MPDPLADNEFDSCHSKRSHKNLEGSAGGERMMRRRQARLSVTRAAEDMFPVRSKLGRDHPRHPPR